MDFSNDTIYLPGGFTSHLSEQELQSTMQDGKVDEAQLKRLVADKTALLIPAEALQSQPAVNHEQLAYLLAPYAKALSPCTKQTLPGAGVANAQTLASGVRWLRGAIIPR